MVDESEGGHAHRREAHKQQYLEHMGVAVPAHIGLQPLFHRVAAGEQHVESTLALPRRGTLQGHSLGRVAVGRLKELSPRVQPHVHGVDGEGEVGEDGEQVHVRERLLGADVREC